MVWASGVFLLAKLESFTSTKPNAFCFFCFASHASLRLAALQASSSSQTEEVQRAQAAAPPPLVQQSSTEMAARFGGMRTWESSDHPIVLYKLDPDTMSSVSGVDIIR